MKFDFSSINAQNIKKGIGYIKENGLNGVMSRVRYKMNGIGNAYNTWFKNNEPDEEEYAAQRSTKFEYAPLISILVPVYMTPEKLLRDMIDSVVNQTYPNWQLCIVDGSGKSDTLEWLETERVIRQYMETDKRICYKRLNENYGISGNTNKALEIANGEYIALLDHDDVLTEDALFHMVTALQTEKYDVLYSDEDKMSTDGNKFMDPAFKPDFSPELLRAHNYITHFLVVKRSLALAVEGFHSEYDGAQDYDFVLRCTENTTSIKHISRILYHWRINDTSVAADPRKKEYAKEAGRSALADHLKRMGYYATATHTDMWGIYKVTYDTPGNPLLSIVIPGGEDVAIAQKCLKPLFENSRYSNFEIIIVDSGIGRDREILRFYHKFCSTRKNVRVVSYIDTDGIAGIRNYGASLAKGDYILFLANNIQITDPVSINEMLGLCMSNNKVGIVGGCIYDTNDIICHEGLAVGLNGMFSHLYKGIKKGDFGYLMHNRVNANYSAVSASCLMIKKSQFEKLGGFSDKFKTELVDIDFCLKARELNKWVVCAADSSWRCHKVSNEIVIAGKSFPYEQMDDTTIKREEDLFGILWSNILKQGDPYYNLNFNRKGEPFTL